MFKRNRGQKSYLVRGKDGNLSFSRKGLLLGRYDCHYQPAKLTSLGKSAFCIGGRVAVKIKAIIKGIIVGEEGLQSAQFSADP